MVWAPPQQFIDEQAGLKALFNIGAGVDALLKLRLPPGLRVGYGSTTPAWPCRWPSMWYHALIRHFREFDDYEASARAAAGATTKPASGATFPMGVMGLGVLGERVARAVAQFDFPVRGWSRSPKRWRACSAFTALRFQ